MGIIIPHLWRLINWDLTFFQGVCGSLYVEKKNIRGIKTAANGGPQGLAFFNMVQLEFTGFLLLFNQGGLGVK